MCKVNGLLYAENTIEHLIELLIECDILHIYLFPIRSNLYSSFMIDSPIRSDLYSSLVFNHILISIFFLYFLFQIQFATEN